MYKGYINVEGIKDIHYELGQCMDFTWIDDFSQSKDKHIPVKFKGTIIAVSNEDYALEQGLNLENLIAMFNGTVDLKENLSDEPFYFCILHDNKIGNYEAGQTIIFPQSFINYNLTVPASSIPFSFKIDMELGSLNPNFLNVEQVKDNLIAYLTNLNLSPVIKDLSDYSTSDVDTIMFSLKFYVGIHDNIHNRNAVINLITTAAPYVIVYENNNVDRYELRMDKDIPRRIHIIYLDTPDNRTLYFNY